MNCEKYREELNRYLDTGLAGRSHDAMLEHTRSCEQCQEYSSSLLDLHTKLLSLPREQPSAKFLRELSSIEQIHVKSQRAVDWKSEMRRALVFLAPVPVVVLFHLFLAGRAEILEFIILTAGLAWVFAGILKPLFFSRIGQGT
jgi:predicted anti-sigma-YlaC factor YlaD